MFTGEELASRFECREILRVSWLDVMDALCRAGRLPDGARVAHVDGGQVWQRFPSRVFLKHAGRVLQVVYPRDDGDAGIAAVVNYPIKDLVFSLRSADLIPKPNPDFVVVEAILWQPHQVGDVLLELWARRGHGKYRGDAMRRVRPAERFRFALYEHRHLLMSEVWPWFYLGMIPDLPSYQVVCRRHGNNGRPLTDDETEKMHAVSIGPIAYAGPGSPVYQSVHLEPAHFLAPNRRGQRELRIYAAMCTCRRIYWALHVGNQFDDAGGDDVDRDLKPPYMPWYSPASLTPHRRHAWPRRRTGWTRSPPRRPTPRRPPRPRRSRRRRRRRR